MRFLAVLAVMVCAGCTPPPRVADDAKPERTRPAFGIGVTFDGRPGVSIGDGPFVVPFDTSEPELGFGL